MTYFLVYATGARLTEKHMARPARVQRILFSHIIFRTDVRPNRDYRDDIDGCG